MTLNERAARAMGQSPCDCDMWQSAECTRTDCYRELPLTWEPENNIAHAWQLVERMQELGWTWFSVGRDIGCERWVAYFDKPGGPQIIAGDDESAPAAITRAACKAWEESQ